jgi:hypothetical protein
MLLINFTTLIALLLLAYAAGLLTPVVRRLIKRKTQQ